MTVSAAFERRANALLHGPAVILQARDPMQTLPWILLLIVLLVATLGGLALWARTAGQGQSLVPLPTEWALTARPVFATDERRVYRLLREALPHHIVLAKLPLVRFCQPIDSNEVRYWYDLLGSHHVAFAVCSANGRVLAALDLEIDRGSSRRVIQIKQSVLAACRVRYLRCPPDRLPTVAELQLLVPQHTNTPRGPQPAPAPAHTLHEARDSLSSTVAHRRAERTALWQDSTFFQDSFFALDSRFDGLSSSDFGALGAPLHENSGSPAHDESDAARQPATNEDLGGIVVDATRDHGSTHH
jgi:hypothetical protein